MARPSRFVSLNAFLLIATACATGGPATTPTTTSTPVPTPTPDPTFVVDHAMTFLEILAVDIGPRPAGGEGDGRAVVAIRAALEEQGYVVERRLVPLPQGGSTSNLVASPPGLDGRYLLVGGHYDTLDGPGANDNGTGVAVLIELARALAAQPASLPVVFVAFGGEERQPAPERPHHVGSRHFVDRMSTAERNDLVAMLNLDMVGIGNRLIAGRLAQGPVEATQRLINLADTMSIPIREQVTSDWSDNGSFLKAELNAGWIWAGEDPCCIHSPRDVYDRVQPETVERAGVLALAFLRSYT